MQKAQNKLVSVIIAAYNEEKTLGPCLKSLSTGTYRPLEIIIVDDGSTDNTIEIIKNFKLKIANLKLLRQKHLGPGSARNLGASVARGVILVFVDADMSFAKNFIADLTLPILKGETIGTFSKNEMVANYDNIWSICWNLNNNLSPDRRLPANYPDQAPVFRAILKSQFDKIGGFDTTGEYTDDWSLSRKLQIKSTIASGAFYYHANPDNLSKVFKQARWIGKNEFIAGTLIRKIRSLIWYSLPVSFMVAFIKSLINFRPQFIIFKLVYDLAVFISVIRSFFGEKKAK